MTFTCQKDGYELSVNVTPNPSHNDDQDKIVNKPLSKKKLAKHRKLAKVKDQHKRRSEKFVPFMLGLLVIAGPLLLIGLSIDSNHPQYSATMGLMLFIFSFACWGIYIVASNPLEKLCFSLYQYCFIPKKKQTSYSYKLLAPMDTPEYMRFIVDMSKKYPAVDDYRLRIMKTGRELIQLDLMVIQGYVAKKQQEAEALERQRKADTKQNENQALRDQISPELYSTERLCS